MNTWNSCKRCSSCFDLRTLETSLIHLIDKSLIVLEENVKVLAMHDLLKEMGQDFGKTFERR